jgi:hypothetical protein
MQIDYSPWYFKKMPIAITQDNVKRDVILFLSWSAQIHTSPYTVAVFRIKPKT